MKKLLGLRELASHIGVTESTVRAWYANGYLPPPHIPGPQPKWSIAAIDRWLDELPNTEGAIRNLWQQYALVARMQEYPRLSIQAVCDCLNIPIPTLADLEHVVVQTEKRKTEPNYHLGRIKYFVQSVQPLALVISGGCNDFPCHEPVLWDGRHRYLAAVLNGKTLIRTEFRTGYGVPESERLPQSVAKYLRGESNIKPSF